MILTQLSIDQPPGFQFVPESLEKALKEDPRLVRCDTPEPSRAAFFTDQMGPGEEVALSFEIQATHPVKAAVQPVEVSSMHSTDARAQEHPADRPRSAVNSIVDDPLIGHSAAESGAP